MTKEMLQKQCSALSTMDQERMYTINIGEGEISRSPIRFQEAIICSNDVITPLDRLPHRRPQAVPQIDTDCSSNDVKQAIDLQASQPISKHSNDDSAYKLLKQWKNEKKNQEFNKRFDRDNNCHSMQKLLSVGGMEEK